MVQYKIKRGKAKFKTTTNRYMFYSTYRKATTSSNKLTRIQFDAFTKELMNTLTTAMVVENMELKMTGVGNFRIVARDIKLENSKHGYLKFAINWIETHNLWKTKYPGKTMEELKLISGKPLIRFENENCKNEFYNIAWDRNYLLTNKTFYKVILSRVYKRLITKVVTDPNRKVFYYGKH